MSSHLPARTCSVASSGCRDGTSSSRSGLMHSAFIPKTSRLKMGMHPAELIPRNIANFTRQLASIGRNVSVGARAVDHRSCLLQVDAVALPAAVQARARLQEERRGELVPQRQDRALQRAGDCRCVRALRHHGGAARARAVVFPDHRLCRTPARQSRRSDQDGLVCDDGDGAEELDRQERRRGDRRSR